MKLVAKNNQILKTLSALVIIVFITGCSPEPRTAMPPAQITRFVLDLSGSNNVVDQFNRLKPAIYEQLKLNSLGNPFASTAMGPVDLSMTFIVGSASQAKVIRIISSDLGYSLYDDLYNVYERSSLQVVNDWPLILAAEQKAFNMVSTSKVQECPKDIFKTMSGNLGEENAKTITAVLCKRVIETVNTIENKILSSITAASASDVFGSFREIDTWVEKIKSTNSNSKIKVVFASDMVHWTNGQRDLFGNNGKGLLSGKVGKNEICDIAAKQSGLSALNLQGVAVDIIGRGNSDPNAKDKISADEGEALAIFWKCFAESSKFELNTITDGEN